MKKVAVILSGCGVFDGAEIYESVLTLLRIAEQGATFQCMAPDIDQLHVINHRNGEIMAGETRNVLTEAARICRGEIIDLADANPAEYQALIIPGGFGVAKNLSDFASVGPDCMPHPQLQHFVEQMQQAGKPIGMLCIAPALAPKLFGEGVTCTIGSDQEVSAAIDTMGGLHQPCAVDDIVVDQDKRLVTTPAYMLAGSILEAASGINKLVDKVLEMA